MIKSRKDVDEEVKEGELEASETQSTSDTQSTSIGRKLNRSDSLVRFEEVQVQEYPITVGDNPGGLMGIPVTIDWQPVSSTIYDLENYEDARTGQRRSMQELRMHSKHREQVLLDLGFSRTDLNWGLKRANIGRVKRRRTVRFMELYERIGKASRQLQRLVTLGRRKRAKTKSMADKTTAKNAKFATMSEASVADSDLNCPCARGA